MLFYFIYAGVAVFSAALLLYYQYHDAGGVRVDDLTWTFVLGVIWPLTILIVLFLAIKEKLEAFQRNNQGYLVRKPTPEEIQKKKLDQFNNNVKDIIE